MLRPPEKYFGAARLRATLLVWVVLAVGVALSLGAWGLARLNAREHLEENFSTRVVDLRTALDEKIAGYQHLLEGAAGFFASSEEVTRDEWRRFCETLSLERRYPAIQALAFARRIEGRDLDAATLRLRQSGVTGFTVRPPGERPLYVANVYTEPHKGLNVKAVGYDMWQDPVRRAAMEKALATRRPAITPKTALKIDEEEHPVPAVIMYLPAFDGRGAHVGFVLIPLRVKELVGDLGPLAFRGVSLAIYDGDRVAEEALLYRSAGAAGGHTPLLIQRETLSFGGRSWTLEFHSEAAMEALDGWRSPSIVLGVGLLFSVALAAIAAGMSASERRAVDLAEHMTRSLRENESRLRAINRDLDEQKRLLDAIVNGTSDAVFFKDPAGRYRLVNREVERLFALPREKILGLDDTHFFPPHEAATLMAGDRAIMEGGKPVLAEELVTTVDGLRVYLAAKGPVYDESGALIGLFGISRDITERRRMEEELAVSKELFALFMRYSPVYTYIKEVSAEGSRVLQASENFEQMVGIRGSDMIGKTMPELFPPEFADKITQDDRDVVASGKVLTLDEELGGRQYTTIKFPIRQGDRTLLAGFTIDVTERKAAQNEAARLRDHLAQSQKLESIGKLAGGVAHDFNNMLGVILGHAEMALGELGNENPSSAHLREIETAAARSAAITRQLLAFARKQAIAPRVLNLNQTLDPMLSMIKRLIGEDIELAWHPGPDLWNVCIDPSQVDQLMANLATNARDAISGVGHVVVQTGNVTLSEAFCREHPIFLPGDYVLLAVRDDGVGIEPDKLPNIFDPFFTTKEFGKGTGLGLATVYGIVKQNGGFIDVASQPGQGSTFCIYLPKVEAEAHDAVPEAVAAGKGRETLLVVEDELSSLNLLRQYLASLGYRVFAAADPAEALTLAADAGKIDLLITDVVMPGMDGGQLAETLLERGIVGNCLFMSGYPDDVIAHRGVLAERGNFLEKPYSLRVMAAKVRQILDEPPNKGA